MARISKKDILPGKMGRKKLSDAGMALVLILLLVGFFSKNALYYQVAIPVLLLNMAVPRIYFPFAWVWYSFSNLMGLGVSRILMTIIYVVLVIPIGVFRRITGKDGLGLGAFRKASVSVMKHRDHTFVPEDLERPY